MIDRARTIRGVLIFLVVGGAIGLIVWLNRGTDPATTPGGDGTQAAIPLPPYSQSRYLNTGSDAKFIGTAACAECHKNNHESYLLTAHSRALADLDPKAEPADGSFHHPASGRTYRVYRKDNQFRHEEIVQTSDGKDIARLDLPVKYLIGSGSFCRSYLIEVDGFLHESPLTWYTQKKKWDMSPGYDFAQHWSFERPVRAECLNCHAGRVEPVGQAVHRVKIHEQSIGCESCHGPGSKHAELHRSEKKLGGEEDLTIVHPGRLSRANLEAICSVCHLSGSSAVYLRGRRETDFRPGMPLTDYRIDYVTKTGSDQMTVVGHMEQLRRSACYKKSEMTCLTCHDPHAREKPKDTVAFYRQKCVSCHETKGCSIPAVERRKQDAADNCATCHMPRGDTDIPHIAFTHHRIGKHSKKRPVERSEVAELVPINDVSHLSAIDQKRNLGLAYLKLVENAEEPGFAAIYSDRARKSLEDAYASGLREGVTAAGLAECFWKTDSERAAAFAREALVAPDLPSEARARSLLIAADQQFKERDYRGAIVRLEELVRLRRFAEDWRLLGVSYFFDRQPQKAVEALQHALTIRPTRHDIHGALSEIYMQLGDRTRAREHGEKATWLLRNRQE